MKNTKENVGHEESKGQVGLATLAEDSALKEAYIKRRQEILAASRKLYSQRSYKDITIKDISACTSLSRPSLYNYFKTKESIFLEIFRDEYTLWCDDMDRVGNENATLSLSAFAEEIAQTVMSRPTLLRLLSVELYELEANCSLEELTIFKRAYGRALKTMAELLRKFFPSLMEADIQKFIMLFFPFMFGLYPYSQISSKQLEAMRIAGISFESNTVGDYVVKMIETTLLGLGVPK